MSTDTQKLSIAIQAQAIALEAARRGLQIVRTYADEGRSGLRLTGRAGLQSLLRDVEGGEPGFSRVLVYDVSRWGRFQDPDEAATYELRCRRAGVSVEYCAEQFENNGSMTSAIAKAIKRAMAAEYSRELSVKVHASQARLASQGHILGGPTIHGLSRQLMDEHGVPRLVMSRGQRKRLQSDRIRYVHGPASEVARVRAIYRWFLSGQSEAAITRRLNRDGPSHTGRAWTPLIVKTILKNELYRGCYIWNRKSTKLGTKPVLNATESWIRVEGVCEPIISLATFQKAQAIFAGRQTKIEFTDAIESLRELLQRSGRLSEQLVKADPACPSPSWYKKTFGSLRRAYTLAGWEVGQRDHEIRSRRRAAQTLLVEKVQAALECAGGRPRRTAGHLTLDGVTKTRVLLAGPLDDGKPWRLRSEHWKGADFLIIACLASWDGEIEHYYVLPRTAQSIFPATIRAKMPTIANIYRRPDLVEFAQLNLGHPIEGRPCDH